MKYTVYNGDRNLKIMKAFLSLQFPDYFSLSKLSGPRRSIINKQ